MRVLSLLPVSLLLAASFGFERVAAAQTPECVPECKPGSHCTDQGCVADTPTPALPDPNAPPNSEATGQATGGTIQSTTGTGAGSKGQPIPANEISGGVQATNPTIDASGTAGARAAGTAPPGAGGGGFMDTRLTWSFGDDDFLHKTGELLPLSPTFSIGDRQQYRLFFDNLNSRFAGRENLTHLVLYKKMPSFIPRLTTEASMVLRFDIAALAANTGNLNAALYDSGSFLRVFYNTNTNKEKEGLSAVFFPLDTDRVRLGYLYDISWGGTAANINQSIFPRIQGASPGVKFQYDHEKFYAYGAFKTATIVQPQQVLQGSGGETEAEVVRVGETNFGFLGGAGVDFTKNFRADLGAGFFQQGKFDLEDVRGKNVYTYGFSGRLIVHDKMPVPQSIDFQLYRNDPNAPMVMFRKEQYTPGQIAWSGSVESSVLRQHLKNFDASGQTKEQTAVAVAAQLVGKIGYARGSLTGIYRDLKYVVRNVPGFIPFETLPENSSSDPELFGAAALDYYIEKARLTPQIGGGLQMPATFNSVFSDGGVQASRTIVVRQQGNESILPYNTGRTPIIQARISLKWDLSDFMAAVLWAQFVRDNNGTLVVRDPNEGTASLRVFQDPNRIGAGLALQARF